MGDSIDCERRVTMGTSNSKPTAAQMQEMVFGLKLQAKELSRSAQKSAKASAAEKKKIKKALEQGNMEAARLYTENTIRKNRENMNYQKLSARAKAVASKLDSAVQINRVSAKMSKITQKLGPTMNAMSTPEVAKNMGDFESMFEDMEVREQMMGDAIDGTTTNMIPEDEVSALLSAEAAAHNIEIGHLLPDAVVPGAQGDAAQEKVGALDAGGEATLEERLAALRAT